MDYKCISWMSQCILPVKAFFFMGRPEKGLFQMTHFLKSFYKGEESHPVSAGEWSLPSPIYDPWHRRILCSIPCTISGYCYTWYISLSNLLLLNFYLASTISILSAKNLRCLCSLPPYIFLLLMDHIYLGTFYCAEILQAGSVTISEYRIIFSVINIHDN